MIKKSINWAVHFGVNVISVDPGFPRRGANFKVGAREGANLLFGQIFSRKLHENERNWIERGTSLTPNAL